MQALPPLLLAALFTALLLLALWVLLERGLWLSLRLFDPLLERSRLALEQERIMRRHAATRHLLRQTRRRHRVIDLDGQPKWLLPEELESLQRRFWAELGLPVGTPWPLVRHQWRRRSLAWHPDRGGDPAVWLRKQRAYEGLRTSVAASPGRTPDVRTTSVRAPAAIAPARSRWWRRWRSD